MQLIICLAISHYSPFHTTFVKQTLFIYISVHYYNHYSPTDFLKELRHFLWVFHRNWLNSPLKHQEVLCLNVNPQLLQLAQIVHTRHHLIINPILGRVSLHRPLEAHLGTIFIHIEDSRHGAASRYRLADRSTVNQVAQPLYTKTLRTFTHHETDGVHKVGLAGSVRPDNGVELLQGTDYSASPCRI